MKKGKDIELPKIELKIVTVSVRLESLSDIMFNRFIDQSAEQRPPQQKMYLDTGNVVCLPAENIKAFLFGEFPAGCARKFEGKKGKDYMQVGLGHVFIKPSLIPFLRDGKPAAWKEFDGTVFKIDRSSPRVRKGNLSIKQNVIERPVLTHPWSLEFEIDIVENNSIDYQKLYNWFVSGGILLALGTHRPEYGRFTVTEWKLS
jgi:hypothetical protein